MREEAQEALEELVSSALWKGRVMGMEYFFDGDEDALMRLYDKAKDFVEEFEQCMSK